MRIQIKYTVFSRRALILITSVCLLACSPKIKQNGKASYYSDRFNGKRTASGAKFRNGKLTAAHKTIPFGTRVKVTNLKTGKSVKVTINDRGPFVPGRIIDLSKKAAKRIGMFRQGVAQVQIQYKKGR